MGNRIAVLASEGFIGSAVLHELRRRGHDPIPMPTSSNGPRLDRSAEWLNLIGIDTVFLCAGRTGGVGRMQKDPLSFVLPNVRIHLNVFEAAQKAGVRRVVCGQSITGYPDVSHAVDEDEYGKGTLHPAYFVPGNTWRFIGKAAEMFRELEVVFFRPSNVYGPGNDFDPLTSHVIEATVRKVYERHNPFVIWGNGEELRDPTYIDDLASAMALGLDCPVGAYNVGTGQSVSVNEMVKILFAHADFEPTIEYDTTKPSAIQTRYLNIEKIQTLGWNPSVTIEDGLKRTYEWYAAEKRAAKFTA